ncbi:MAG: hypothetical protein KJO10_09920 [Gammaproteobacteria bacterium]|nr:hypothetical protein [Gammaproteobacteria bacterium]
MPNEFMLSIAIAAGLVGLLFLCLPDRIRSIETWLNTPCGNRELIGLRLGLRRERIVEHAMNRIITSRQIIWDDCLVAHPRLSGLVMCALALGLFISG